MSKNDNQLRDMLNKGALLEVTIRQGSLGCSDAQDACAEWGHLLLHRRGDNYLIDTPDDENIVFVDSEDYILDIVDEFWEHLDGEVTVGDIIRKFPGRRISMLSPGGIVASDNASELLTADTMNIFACSDASMIIPTDMILNLSVDNYYIKDNTICGLIGTKHKGQNS